MLVILAAQPNFVATPERGHCISSLMAAALTGASRAVGPYFRKGSDATTTPPARTRRRSFGGRK